MHHCRIQHGHRSDDRGVADSIAQRAGKVFSDKFHIHIETFADVIRRNVPNTFIIHFELSVNSEEKNKNRNVFA